MTIDVTAQLEAALAQSPNARGISTMAQGLVGSAILKIAGEVRAKIAAGESLLNLTVGDFSPSEFPIPAALSEALIQAVQDGESNYPPANGVLECREAVRELFRSRLGLEYPLESILIAGGARPMIAGAYLALVNRGDKVVFGLPSWNNHYYCKIVGADPAALPTTPESRFFFETEDALPHLSDARLLILNTPQNPTGTVLSKAALQNICEHVVDENKRRQAAGEPALYVLFDQIYWLLTFGDVEHHNPVSLVPEMAPYTIFVDGISKGFAATGLRVGWAVGPMDVIKKMGSTLSHLGAWAPRPEQIATARLLGDMDAVDRFLEQMKAEVRARLDIVSDTMQALKAEGWPVDSIPPQGAIYLSVKCDLKGRTTTDGLTLETDEDVRKFLLEEAGIAVIPFSCFGVTQQIGWFRASVGSVSKADCESIKDRMKRALGKLT